MPNLGTIRTALRPVACTLATPTLTDPTHILLEGVSGAGAPDAALRAAFVDAAQGASVETRVHTFTGPYCAALDALRAVAALGDQPGAALRLSLRGNVSPLRKDERMVLQLTMPDFPAYLQVDYLSSDGTMNHLLQDDGVKLRVWNGSWVDLGPSKTYAPGQRVIIGEPNKTAGFDGWKVGEPFGTDMVIAIASSVPLFARVRPDDEGAAIYLRDLDAALRTDGARGVRLATQAMVVDTAPR